MENQDLEVFDDGEFNNEAPGKRPVFITVLAVLSWVYVGFWLMVCIFTTYCMHYFVLPDIAS